jgi:hypothetical protein
LFTHPELSRELLGRLKIADKGVYNRCVAQLAHDIAHKNSVEAWNLAGMLVETIDDLQVRAHATQAVAHIHPEEDKEDELKQILWRVKETQFLALLMTLLKEPLVFERCMDSYIETEFVHRFRDLDDSVASCVKLLKLVTANEVLSNLTASSIVFYYYDQLAVSEPISKQVIEIFYSIYNPDVRMYTLQRMLESSFKAHHEVKDIIKDVLKLRNSLLYYTEKEYVLRRLVSFMISRAPERVQELQDMLSDPYARIFARHLDQSGAPGIAMEQTGEGRIVITLPAVFGHTVAHATVEVSDSPSSHSHDNHSHE